MHSNLTKEEVAGASVQIIIEAMGRVKDMGLKILEENGVDTKVTVNDSVNLGKFIKSLNAIEAKFGPNTMFMIGKKVPEIVPFPPQIDSFDSAMNSINFTYLNTHKNISKNEDYYKYTKLGGKKAILECTNPYPSEFDRGLISGLARRFPPVKFGNIVEVTLDTTKPTRKNGGTSCTYNLVW